MVGGKCQEMGKVDEARTILNLIGLPVAQQNETSALTLLALCGLCEDDAWVNAQRRSLTLSKGIMRFVAEHYGRTYAPNSRETFRREVLHQFVQAGVVDYNPDNPDLPTNSPKAHYALTDEALRCMRSYGSPGWDQALKEFRGTHGSLATVYKKKRAAALVPVRSNGTLIAQLSPGEHNEVQRAVVEQFAPRFVVDPVLVYLGDTANKTAYVDRALANELGIPIDEHGKLPDVIVYDNSNSTLFLIEVVTSHGPMNPKRTMELTTLLTQCKVGKIFVTAFPTFDEYRKHMKDIAWETEVWIVENADHMIHYNGQQFLQPR